MLVNQVQIQGQIQQETHSFTLASGTATIGTKLKRWYPVGLVQYGASSSVAESLAVVGTPSDTGFFSGDATIESDNASSALTGFLTIQGF